LGPILLRDRKGYAVSLYNRYAEDKTPRYTASLDKAVTLVPEGWKWKAILRDSARGENTGEGYVHNGRLHMSGQYQGADTFAATPALALCAAALRARAAML
ncbi:MAG: hypothetical protein ACK5X3_06635, partial [Pseudomonadota bacterium]